MSDTDLDNLTEYVVVLEAEDGDYDLSVHRSMEDAKFACGKYLNRYCDQGQSLYIEERFTEGYSGSIH